ncbi:OsmC family protein [Aridibaculum aurantiacum]|uniref:OsmC family protein n=1 Tax=Aridibaculum aurantiacum TaxID=2810307 RepID=UPI001A96840C|nr:OsmC family protein [Aridibaculum aurantiacum]
MQQEHYYDVSVTWQGDRKGTMHSDCLPDTIEVATPPEFPKGIEGIWSPEHLFVAAINSCLMTTFLAIAENMKLSYASFQSKAVGKLEMVDRKYMMTEVILKPHVIIHENADSEKALRVLEKSEAACLISNSVKSKIIMEPVVEVQAV